MHLVGYLYEDYHDARSLEHKVALPYFCALSHNRHNFREQFIEQKACDLYFLHDHYLTFLTVGIISAIT
jgi:hypothetical protein